jgi:hypothetical protein
MASMEKLNTHQKALHIRFQASCARPLLVGKCWTSVCAILLAPPDRRVFYGKHSGITQPGSEWEA